MTNKPFRWTKQKQHKLIRDALDSGMNKDAIMHECRKGTKDQRASEAAMTMADWSIAIDSVQERLTT